MSGLPPLFDLSVACLLGPSPLHGLGVLVTHVSCFAPPPVAVGSWDRMPKGDGNRKGKQPALKMGQKRSSEGAGTALWAADLGAILPQIKALERAHGLPPGGAAGCAPSKRGRLTRNAPDLSAMSISSQIHQRLTVVAEKVAGAVVPAAGADSRCAVVSGGALVPVAVPTGWGGVAWSRLVSMCLCCSLAHGLGDWGARLLLPDPLPLAWLCRRVCPGLRWVSCPSWGARGWGVL